MAARGPNLGRLAKTLRRHARDGWQRAVFSRPGAEGEEPQVLEGGTVDALVEAATEAANAGRVKQVLVVDARTRVRIDARYGKAKVHTLDAATKAKVMGGKARVLEPDRSADLLRVIGIMNPDGTISAKSAKKYKQVNHFVELCRPGWERLLARRTATPDDPLRVLDVACGNGYLTFVLTEALRLAEIPSVVAGVDLREDVIGNCTERASALGWTHVEFSVARIADVTPEPTPDILLALHACDTATDEALALGIGASIPVLLVAPCCQRELAAQLASRDDGALTKHGLLRREYGSTLTDALRVELLDAFGYKVDVVEFVESTHSPKNLLLRAHKRPGADGAPSADKLEQVRARCRSLGVEPTLLRLLLARADRGTLEG
ncbi:MAG: class I SAM-dependent methyltransferase [Nannocystaceae bacterium]|nr:SAM-dependent methyltransferase [bacterium]